MPERTPVFYVHPKIHKKFELFPPKCSGYECGTVKISEWLVGFILLVAKRSSFGIFSILCQISTTILSTDDIPKTVFCWPWSFLLYISISTKMKGYKNRWLFSKNGQTNIFYLIFSFSYWGLGCKVTRTKCLPTAEVQHHGCPHSS